MKNMGYSMEENEEFVENCLREVERYNPKFTDVRVFTWMNDDLSMKNGQIEKAHLLLEKGFNVRVIVNGAWGYASSFKIDKKEIPRVVKEAIHVAKASGKKAKTTSKKTVS